MEDSFENRSNELLAVRNIEIEKSESINKESIYPIIVEDSEDIFSLNTEILSLNKKIIPKKSSANTSPVNRTLFLLEDSPLKPAIMSISKSTKKKEKEREKDREKEKNSNKYISSNIFTVLDDDIFE